MEKSSASSSTALSEEIATAATKASSSTWVDRKDEELRLRLEQKLIKEQEEIKFKQLQKEAMRIQKELELQRQRMDALSPPVSKKSSLFIHVESRGAKPTPAQKACVYQRKTVTLNDAANRMSQSMTADMFASGYGEKLEQRALLSPQFMSSGASLESSGTWEARSYQQ